MRVVVTGGAGFIGSHLCERLVGRGHEVCCVDSFDSFYDPAVKRENIAGILGDPRFTLVEADIRDPGAVLDGLASSFPACDVIVHLAARAGVRPSIEDPLLYSQVNLDGTTAMLEVARKLGVDRFVFGSSSSVYGNADKVPFSESDPVDRPISPYAATKRAGELLCHTYHHLFGLSVVCLRFFTVYGPRQRPDLAIHKFTRLLLEGRPIPMFGNGSTERDYTYVDDILQGIEGAIDYTARAEPVFEIVNLGESRTTSLARLIELIGEAVGTKPRIERLPPQAGDVQRTFADVSHARELFGYAPTTPVEAGIPRFVEWMKSRIGGPARPD